MAGENNQNNQNEDLNDAVRQTDWACWYSSSSRTSRINRIRSRQQWLRVLKTRMRPDEVNQALTQITQVALVTKNFESFRWCCSRRNA
ncbi:hypothetical protein OK016_21870 [Vibrio chagasii]|nr:hypothetical protein [Vibrio chagasii]